MTKVYALFFVLIVGITSLCAQDPFPEKNPIYTDTEIPRIDILIHPDSLAIILAEGNEESNHEFPATLIFQSSALKDTVDNIGLRLKGNTSRTGYKKSFKVSFNTFIKGKKYFGLEKMNLNADRNDPSLIRSKLSWDILRSIGVPAPRANHVQLYINNEYRGLYMNVEHIDEEFARLRFGTDRGNLYKCLYPADLKYLGDNPDGYKYVIYERQPYALKTNEEADDYSDLSGFISVLNNTPLAELPDELEKIFNVNSFLKFLAVETITGHWDSYSYLKNNYYLYSNPLTGRFEYIPDDMDNTLPTT